MNAIKFLEEVLDQEHQIKISYVKEKGWDNTIVPVCFYYREAAWLYEYLALLKTDVLEVYHFEYDPAKEEKITFAVDDIEKLVFNLNKNRDKYTILTNAAKDFLIYKFRRKGKWFESADYSLYFGDEECLEQLTKLPHSIERKWLSRRTRRGRNKIYSHLWRKYKGEPLGETETPEYQSM